MLYKRMFFNHLENETLSFSSHKHCGSQPRSVSKNHSTYPCQSGLTLIDHLAHSVNIDDLILKITK